MTIRKVCVCVHVCEQSFDREEEEQQMHLSEQLRSGCHKEDEAVAVARSECMYECAEGPKREQLPTKLYGLYLSPFVSKARLGEIEHYYGHYTCPYIHL